jgi:hypothetical protein
LILRKSLFFFILFSVCFFAYSQENQDETDETYETDETDISILEEDAENKLDDILQNDIYTDESIFIINSFNYNVKGLTLPFVLNTKTELKKGEEITGKTNFIKFIKDKKQLLVNERVLKDNVRIEYTIGEMTEDGKYPVDLQIYVEDTFNIIALPYPKFDSNYGFSITLKARDYNFFGSMQPFRVDLGYKIDQEDRTYFNIMLDAGMPFQAFGLNWFLDFDNYFEYRPDLIEPFYFKNRTALSVDIPIKRTTLNLGFAESFLWNEENSDSDKPAYGQVQEGLYLSSKPNISWKIPTGLEIGEYGELTYNSSVSAVINHEISDWELSINRIGPFIYFNHSLSFGRIDWIGNFRKGISLDFSNSYSYDIHYAQNDWNPWSYSYSITSKGHFIFLEDLFGLSAKLSHKHWINSNNEYSGEMLRGVYDKDVNAELIVTLNLDLQVRALRIKPYEWFGDNKFWRVFGFDVHLNPVFDMAWYKPPSQDASTDSKYFLFGAGFEIIVYPQRFRSMFIRLSVCWDISDITKNNPVEIFLGMEHFY